MSTVSVVQICSTAVVIRMNQLMNHYLGDLVLHLQVITTYNYLYRIQIKTNNYCVFQEAKLERKDRNRTDIYIQVFWQSRISKLQKTKQRNKIMQHIHIGHTVIQKF